MNDETPQDRFPSDENRGRARERMSADYEDAPPRRPVGRTAPQAGGAVSQALSQFLNSDTGTRRLVYGAAGLGGLLLVGIGGWALVGHHQSGIPVLGPPPVAMRTKPVDPGGMQLDGVTMPEADDGQAHPVPAPEKPNPTALAAQYGQEAAKTDAASNEATGGATQPVAGSAQGTEGATTPKGPEQQAQGGGQDTAQAGGDIAQPTTLPEVGSGSDDESAAGDSAAAAAPVPTPAPAAVKAAQPAKVVAKATPSAPALAPAKPKAESLPPPSPVPAPTGGKYRVQLAALQTDAQAQQEWSRLKTRYPALFGDRTPVIEKIQRDNAVFYRLRVGGFASTAETRTFCSAVRDRGLACAQVHQ